ncbi:MAG: 2,3-diphosphoglycerate-dependent phosphoglycerate mutase [Hyphomonadaceae bacterium]|nr:2,3-diphosphoglycerate-dependent phosphoglycerate mutase [Hyphomonadaceae bacterium]MBC6412029.1 2,3-diphosphoglycerate-dependent phosphoglycerate mutase [Hyphomonadaceae bacterium]
MTQLVLVRHGQSQWNLQNRFTGWVDVDLTGEGIAQVKTAGDLLTAENITFDAGFTSYLKRAIRTLWLLLESVDRFHIPVTKDWRLNERHYGRLTGLNKQETRDKYGDQQVQVWRRSFDTPPPSVGPDNQFHPANDAKYRDIDPALLPGTESLKLTMERVLPYFESDIAPHIVAGRTLIIVAHGNSLRVLMKSLFGVSDTDIAGCELPTGNPLLIDLEDGTLNVTAARFLDESRAIGLPPHPGG